MSKHTPDTPWELHGVTIWDSTGDVAIATVEQHVLSTFAEREANGKLLAAAPELLERLRDLVDFAQPDNLTQQTAFHRAKQLLERLDG